MTKRYLIVIESTATGYSAYSPDHPGCVATGGAKSEVEARMRDAIQLHLAGLRDPGEPVREPSPTPVADGPLVAPDPREGRSKRMNRTILAAMTLALAAGNLASCQPAAQPVAIGEQDAGGTVALKVGDTLVVSLDGNPTTGFTWAPAAQDPVLLRQVGETEFQPESDRTGAPGKVILRFEAGSPGQTLLRLYYGRSWEADDLPAETFEVTVVVE